MPSRAGFRMVRRFPRRRRRHKRCAVRRRISPRARGSPEPGRVKPPAGRRCRSAGASFVEPFATVSFVRARPRCAARRSGPRGRSLSCALAPMREPARVCQASRPASTSKLDLGRCGRTRTPAGPHCGREAPRRPCFGPSSCERLFLEKDFRLIYKRSTPHYRRGPTLAEKLRKPFARLPTAFQSSKENSMSWRTAGSQPVRSLGVAFIALACLAVTGTGRADDDDRDQGGVPFAVPKARCGPRDHPETALQGQVPLTMRLNGFKGFNCNLELIGQSRNDGANWQTAEYKERHGSSGRDDDRGDGDRPRRTCGYYGSQSPELSPATRNHASYGVPVIDLTDANHPNRTGYLQTTSMLDPWESLKVNERRQLLMADNGHNGGGGPEVDVYDLSMDCSHPQLLAVTAIGTGTDGGTLAPVKPIGHEGSWAPDGLTYYIGDTTNRSYHAVDVSDPKHPRHIATFDMKTLGLASHGLSISDDGNRGYMVTPGIPSVANPAATPTNGFVVLDLSEVQARKPNAQMKYISQYLDRK